ncbi:hypothetical protein S820908_212 [Synechococcus phage S-CAM9]|uniref:Uncharacterized protein n=1 Tax=Synechococcus phage S-CAM9 TaxID=1883369 RepID=A0A1D8KPV0_9CAUD|nr:hypothetical protein BOW85_gp036 [Synechococcus phage S-CAM9]AOV60359.1 hypothetical protein S050808_212 [Synechococcus phage S-CAM9]AOV60587.1 hypothetical protein S820908_212 [Synechococcus phage S-CAM9]AOV60816.1 hypothetical protein N161109_213 [Synechococcus phage S-CAM9]
MNELYYDVEKAIDYAFDGRFVLKMYDYLRVSDVKRPAVEEFIHSSTAQEIADLVNELEEYLEGGSDYNHKLLREAYGHIPKPQVRKIKTYLYGILEDAWQYSNDKKPGRKKGTKNRKKVSK